MKKRIIPFYIFLFLTIASNIFILVEGAIGGEGSAAQSVGLTQAFIDFIASFDSNSPIVLNPELTHTVIRKLVGHFGLFGVTGVFTILAMLFTEEGIEKRKIQTIVLSLPFGFSVALFSELEQLFTPGRFFTFNDVLIDFSGYILLGGITFLIFYLIYRHNCKKEKETDVPSLG